MSTAPARRVLSRVLLTVATLVTGVGGLSCGGEATGPTTGVAARLDVVAGQDQTFTVGSELPDPLRVRVLDDQGRPVAGQLMNFRVLSGGGSMFAGSAITTADGMAADRWTLGTVAGKQQVEARAVDATTGAGLVFGTFQAVAVAGAPAAITKAAGDLQTGVAGGVLSTPLSTKVTDRFGNPVIGATVTFTAAPGSGSVSPASAITDSSGAARSIWTLGPSVADSQVVVPAVGALRGAPFTATVTAGAPTRLSLSTAALGSWSTLPFLTQPVVRIVDALGNVVASPGAVVTLSASTGAGVAGTATAPVVNGVASFVDAGLSGPAGSYTLTYSASVAGIGAATQTVSIGAGTPALLIAAQPPASARAGAGFATAPVVQLVDPSGAPLALAGVRATLGVSAGPGGSLQGTTTIATDANGRATFGGLHIDGAVGTYRLEATASGVARAQTDSIALSAGPATQLAFVQQPANAARLALMSPALAVAARDQFGNPNPDFAEAVTLSLASNPNGAVLTGGAATLPAGGIATFPSAMLDRAGSGYVLRASTASGLVGSSATFDSSPVATLAVAPSSIVAQNGTSYSSPVTGRLSVAAGVVSYQVSVSDALSWVFTVPSTGGGTTQRYGDLRTGLNSYTGVGLASDASGSYFHYELNSFPAAPSSTSRACNITGIPTITPAVSLCTGRFSLEAGYLYVATSHDTAAGTLRDGTVTRIAIADGGSTVLQSLPASTPALTVANGQIYYADSASGSIKRLPTSGGAPSTVTSIVGQVSELAVANGVLYWLEKAADGTTSIMSAPSAGGAPTLPVAGLPWYVHSLVTDGTVLYVIAYDSAVSGSGGGTLLRYAVADFSSAISVGTATDVALDDQSVYWTNRTERAVKKAAK